MGETSLIFPASEYKNRVNRLQGAMSKHGLDALLLTSQADIFYVTGFLTRFWESPARPWFVVVPARTDPIAVIPSIGSELMGRTWINEIHTWDAPYPGDDGVSLLSKVLTALLPETSSVGTAKGLETHLRMPLADFEAVQAIVAPRAFVDATDVIQRCREIKSEAEIEKIRSTCQIADRAFARVPDIAQSGKPLDAVFRDFQIALLEEGADWVSYVAGASDTNGYADVISPAQATPLALGDVLMLDTGAVKDGYFCDFDRNFSVGPASAEVLRVHQALWDVTEDVLNELRPGSKASDVHRMFDDGLKAHGVKTGGGRLGHGLGVSLTEWPSFTPHDHTELRSGMVLTLEPGAHVTSDRVIVHEENIVLRETGVELLSKRAPRDIPELR